jgi:ABC-type multidrug transport system fused ATPase/permease subunit
VAGESRTCVNCGNEQPTGDFCARCGARLSGATAPSAVGQAYQHYAVPRAPGPFSRLFDFSFQGFITRGSLRTIFVTTLVLLALYWLLALIFGIVAAAESNAFWCIGIFSSLFLVSLLILWTRVMMELTMTVAKMREDMEKAAAEKAEGKAAPKAKK